MLFRSKELYPEFESYIDVYKHYGFIDKRTVLAHCCLMSEKDWQILHKHEATVAHCPSSNLFLGDGVFRFRDCKNVKRPVIFGIGTDVGAGTNLSVFRQLNEAHKVGMLNDKRMTPLQCLYLATKGGARTLHLDDRIGSIEPGFEADITVIDMKPSDFAECRMAFSKNLFDKIGVLQTLSPDNLIKATFVNGKKVYDADNKEKPFSYANE